MPRSEGETILSWRVSRRNMLVGALAAPFAAQVAFEEFSPAKHRTRISREEAMAIGDILRPYNYTTIAHDAGNSDEGILAASRAGVNLVEMDLAKVRNMLYADHKKNVVVPAINVVIGGLDVKPIRPRLGPPTYTAEMGFESMSYNRLDGVMVEWKLGRGDFTPSDFRQIERRGKQYKTDVRHHTGDFEYFKEISHMIENSSKNAYLPNDPRRDERIERDNWNQFINYARDFKPDRKPAVISDISSILYNKEILKYHDIPCYVFGIYNAENAQSLIDSGVRTVAIFNETEIFKNMKVSKFC